VAPDMYSLDDNGYLVLDETAVPEEQRHSARRGARACPERAIIVVEDESVS
jgi:ferredoxin